jgi:DNA repair photolyase
VRGTSHGGRLPFDPYTTEALAAALDAEGDAVRTIVLSPQSDPFVPYRPVQSEAVRVAEFVLERGLDLVILTRGRLPLRLIERLSAYPKQARVGLGLFSLNKPLVRSLEPLAASPRGRVRTLRRLASLGVPVEVRLEPLVPGLTDTRENLEPLFRAVAHAGVTKVVAHYLFFHPSIQATLEPALALHAELPHLMEMFADGVPATVGSLGLVRNLARDVRREGLARVISWGAEFGLDVTTGAAQNPDLPRTPPRRPAATRNPGSAPTVPGSGPEAATLPRRALGPAAG